MIHTAATPKTGEATASTLVARPQAGARRNRIAQSIQEVGRVAKTRFMLAYLEDDIYRRQINRQLNKGETLHALRSYIFYANSGEIWHRQLEEQTAQSLCLNLVTNAIVTWNTRYLGASIDHLNAASQTRPDDDLSRVSPTMRRHINPYGRFIFANHTTTELRPLRTGHPYPA